MFYSLGCHFGKGFFNSNQGLKNITRRENKFNFFLEIEYEKVKKVKKVKNQLYDELLSELKKKDNLHNVLNSSLNING